jgi:hypothetical protein
LFHTVDREALGRGRSKNFASAPNRLVPGGFPMRNSSSERERKRKKGKEIVGNTMFMPDVFDIKN